MQLGSQPLNKKCSYLGKFWSNYGMVQGCSRGGTWGQVPTPKSKMGEVFIPFRLSVRLKELWIRLKNCPIFPRARTKNGQFSPVSQKATNGGIRSQFPRVVLRFATKGGP